MEQRQKIYLTYCDSKSDKFWEIEQNEAHVQVRWGRAGTTGQGQEKQFGSAAEAATFVAKQTAAKRKKGYSAASEPPPSAALPGWTPPCPKSLRHCFADGLRGHAVVEPLPEQPDAALKTFQGQLREQLMRAKCADEPEIQAIFKELQTFILPGDHHGDITLDMAAVALAMQRMNEQGGAAWLMLQKGLPFTVEALLRALQYDYGYMTLPGQGLQLVLRKAQPEAVFAPWSYNLGQLALHQRLREEPIAAPAYQTARERAQVLQPHLGAHSGNLLAFLFSREREWVIEAVEAWRQLPIPPKSMESAESGYQRWTSGWMLWPLAPEVCQAAYQEAFQSLTKSHAAKQDISVYMSAWTDWMLAYLGEGAVETLGLLIREATTAACRKSAAGALKLVETERGFGEMGRCLKTKEGQKTFLPLMSQRADLALPALLDLLAEHPKEAEVRRQAEHLAHSCLEVLERLQLSAAQQRCLKALGAQRAPVDSSVWEELPAILRNPPWRQGEAAGHTPQALDLPLPLEGEWIAWQEGDLQHVTPYVHEKPPLHGAKDAQTLEKIRQVKPGRLELDHLDRLSDAAALEFFNGLLQSADGLTYDPAPQQKSKRFWVGILSEWQMRCTLLRFGPSALPGLIAVSWAKPAECFPVLAKIVSPRLAFTMAQGLQVSAIRQICWQWLQVYRRETALGLLPVALGKSAWAAWGQRLIRQMAAAGWEGDFRAAAAHYGEAADTALADILQPPALFDLPRQLPALPDFWQAGVLHAPRLAASGRALPVEVLDHLGLMLALSTPALPYAGLLDIKRLCSADSLAAFAWSVTQLWLDHGAPGKHDWMLFGLGHLGDDIVVSRLSPLVGKWPGERAHSRALLGLAALKQIGSVSAWAAIQNLSFKSRFPALKEAARKALLEIAAVQGISLDELLDRLVPDHGLDATGQRRFTFGEQVFSVDVGASLKVSLCDAQGRMLKSPPKGAAKEDTAAWKRFKKELETTLGLQAKRLEIAMSQGQKWSVQDFQNLLQNHPVMGLLARRLVWGLWRDGEPPIAFELAEAGWRDQHGQAVLAPATGQVSVLHPVFFAPALFAWQARFAAAGIQQPFEQLHRAIFFPTPEDYVQPRPSRFRGREVDARKLQALIRQGGWQVVYEGEIEKALGEFQAQIMSEISAYALGDYAHCRIYDLRVMRRGICETLPPANLEPAAFSEVLRDVASLELG